MKRERLQTGFRRFLAAVLLLCLCAAWGLPALAADGDRITAYTELSEITSHGNVLLLKDGKRLQPSELESAGILLGDVVELRFLGQTVDAPVVKSFNEVEAGDVMLRYKEDAVELGINMGEFASTYFADRSTKEDGSAVWHYKEGIEGPVQFELSRKTDGGLTGGSATQQLTYTNAREDYSQLSDEQFANFREVTTTGIGKGLLYRSSSPINPQFSRNTYADAALKKAGVVTVLNLADSRQEAEAFPGYADTYYSTTNYLPLRLGMSFFTETSNAKLAEGLRFLAANKGPYAIHCKEGKDRAGVVAALLECFMGASYEEVRGDYMVSYYNYYGIEPGDSRYDEIAEANIGKMLQKLLNTEDLRSADLSAKAAKYFRSLGLTDAELNQLRENLSAPAPAPETVPTAKPETIDFRSLVCQLFLRFFILR